VLQDALLSACKNIRQFQSRAKFSTWMHAILCNSVRTMWRRRRVRPITSPFPSDITDQNIILAEDIPDHGLSPEEEFGRSEAAGTVAELLARLPPIYRDVVLLCKIKELNVADAAHRLGIREGTVKARIHRARAMIQKLATLETTEPCVLAADSTSLSVKPPQSGAKGVDRRESHPSRTSRSGHKKSQEEPFYPCSSIQLCRRGPWPASP
jgi:RNA polymerase sigma factor (sigma-70 family)